MTHPQITWDNAEEPDDEELSREEKRELFDEYLMQQADVDEGR